MRNNVSSLLVPEVSFTHLLLCIVLSMSGRNMVLQVVSAVQSALHYHRARLCLSADCTSVVQSQSRRNPVEPPKFSHIQLHAQ
jgi:hypothetical protein